MPSIHEPRRDAHKQDAFFFVLRAELGNRQVQGRLADGVRRVNVDVEFTYHLCVRHAGADCDRFLRGSLADEG